MEKKYELTDEIKVVGNHKLHRIRALKDFGNIKKNDLGGFIESESNLSHENLCWVSIDVEVFGNARVFGNAYIYGNARVSGDAGVSGKARVSGDAYIYGNARVFEDARVSGDAYVSEDAQVSGDAHISSGYIRSDALIKSSSDFIVFSSVGSENGTLTAYKTEADIHVTRGCFTGTLEEFKEAVKKTHGSNQYGKVYYKIIEVIELQLGA